MRIHLQPTFCSLAAHHANTPYPPFHFTKPPSPPFHPTKRCQTCSRNPRTLQYNFCTSPISRRKSHPRREKHALPWPLVDTAGTQTRANEPGSCTVEFSLLGEGGRHWRVAAAQRRRSGCGMSAVRGFGTGGGTDGDRNRNRRRAGGGKVRLRPCCGPAALVYVCGHVVLCTYDEEIG